MPVEATVGGSRLVNHLMTTLDAAFPAEYGKFPLVGGPVYFNADGSSLPN